MHVSVGHLAHRVVGGIIDRTAVIDLDVTLASLGREGCLEAVERLSAWIGVAGVDDDRQGPLFRPTTTPRGGGHDGFIRTHLTTRAVENLVKKYARLIGLDPAVTVHSLRVTALTTARERGADIIDLQDFAGHADPRTTLTYIRSRDRLSKSPAYVLNY